MQTKSSSRRPLGYAVGSLAILVVSIGVAAVVYSIYPSSFNLVNVPAWVLGPWGLYTIIYAFVTRRDLTYYLAWGTTILAVALVSALYTTTINPWIIFGILLIILAIIGVATYWRGRR